MPETLSSAASASPTAVPVKSGTARGRYTRFIVLLVIYTVWLAALSYVAWVNVYSGNQ